MTRVAHSTVIAGLCAITLLGQARPTLAADAYAAQRAAMIHTIEADVRATSLYLDKEVLDLRVLGALGKVQRHALVPEDIRDEAYANRPLPIGYGQTISQPYIVAVMTDLLQLEPGDHVLEIGTGSGYQAAVLAELVEQVFSMEIVTPLGKRARDNLYKLGYRNITTRVADGYHGWPEHAPFDAIVVTAAASHVPPPLLKQLKPGGHMVIPVGSRFMVQQLVLVKKDTAGEVRVRQVLPVHFVPLTGDHD